MITRREILHLLAGVVPAARLLRSHADSGGVIQTPRTLAAGHSSRPGNRSCRTTASPTGSATPSSASGRTGPRSACPKQGDWYARHMYLQGDPPVQLPRQNVRPPSQFGFMEIDNLWKAEHWEPEKLMAPLQEGRGEVLRRAGQPSRQLRRLRLEASRLELRPRRPEERHRRHLGAKWPREHGLRFGVTNHSAHAWHWFQSAYGYDPEGPRAGVRYDAFRLTKADGKGKWWEGLDPQELYTGRNIVMPDGITTIKAANDWHEKHDRKWTEDPPPNNPDFVESGSCAARTWSTSTSPTSSTSTTPSCRSARPASTSPRTSTTPTSRNHGKLEAVLTSKGLEPDHVGAMVLDIERGRADRHPAARPGRPTPASATGTTGARTSTSTSTSPPTPSSRCSSTSSARTATCC